MITSQQITTADTDWYQFMEHVLVGSFPPEERRPLSELRRVAEQRTNLFHLFIVLNGDTPVGFYNYWHFPTFYYTEHLAIAPAYRNHGYGKQLIASLLDRIDLPLIIEVEPPATETARRRISFYKQLGFRLWERDYLQPPYSPALESVPLKLMTCGALNLACDDTYNLVCGTIHREVYGVREIFVHS
ncbi:MAG: GNAT family N-acetyltransferase [Prevotellaceae bacterium]|jgi:GNAT superfamily N-acetyltransferase|nr:GNAT family N-acetyltransferase [Prevotellaceae bacterium]